MPHTNKVCAPKRQEARFQTGRCCFTFATLRMMLRVLYAETAIRYYRPCTRYGGSGGHNDHRVRTGMCKTVLEAVDGIAQEQWLTDRSTIALRLWQDTVAVHTRMRSELGPPSKAYVGNDWLSAETLGNKLAQFSERYTWRFSSLDVYPSHTLPITSKHIRNKLKKVWSKTRRYSSFGCILNTSHGDIGTHWVAVFFKRRTQCIEYFDSFGAPANTRILKILSTIQQCLQEESLKKWSIQAGCGPKLQQGGTECGMFALYYIKQRLLKRSRSDILYSNPPSDSMMHTLRREYFTPPVASIPYASSSPLKLGTFKGLDLIAIE